MLERTYGGMNMNNYERIKNMSVEEMAEKLSEIWDCNDCTEHKRLSDNAL